VSPEHGRQDQEQGGRTARKGKETAGETANNNELRREGQADQAETGMKQTGENVKDRFKKN
jgi:uncharacterized protein YjbJ (UPF0337 family)